MSEPLDPEAYDAALDRFLDGLESDGPADAQVRADTDAIAKALGLIGGALAAEGGGVTAAAGAVAPVAGGGADAAGGAAGATVVQMSTWRSKLNPRVLAAAASLIVVVGVGIPLTVNATGGSSNDESTTALDAPRAQAESAAGAQGPAVPEAAPMADSYVGTDAAGSAAAPGATDDTSTLATDGAAQDAQALTESQANADAQAKSGAGSATGGKVAREGDLAFEDAVACARAIFVATITNVKPAADGAHFTVTFLVEDWLVPASGPVSATYDVYGSTVNSPGVDENITGGQRRLFVVPASPEERMYAYRQADWPATKERIKAVRQERGGQGC